MTWWNAYVAIGLLIFQLGMVIWTEIVCWKRRRLTIQKLQEAEEAMRAVKKLATVLEGFQAGNLLSFMPHGKKEVN